MDYKKISVEASRYTKSGTLVFILSGAIISLNYYFPSLFPNMLKGGYEYLIKGTYGVFSVSIAYMGWNFIKQPNNPHHVVGENCRTCQKPILYTGVKCSNPECNYKEEFD